MMKRTKKLLILFLFIPAWFVVVGHPTPAASKPPAQGAVLPQFPLEVPEDAEAKDYLGLSDSGGFTVSEIRAQVVVIQILSRY